MRYSDNELWCFLEETKNKLREHGCIELANDIYKRQLKLESELLKEYLCQK